MSNALKTLIIDGEPMALDKLRKFAKKVDYLQIAKACKDTTEALEYMNENPVDVIFIEVSMPPGKPNGIEFIESLSVHPIVVFVSAQKEYAADAYRIGAVDYLLKPYTMLDFQRAADRVKAAYLLQNVQTRSVTKHETVPYIFIRNEKAQNKIMLSDIIYIAGDAEYLAFHIKGYGVLLREKSSFAAIRLLLNSNFIQIHRSTMINMEHLDKVEKGDVVMDNGTRLHVSDGNRPRFMAMLAERTVGKKTAPTED